MQIQNCMDLNSSLTFGIVNDEINFTYIKVRQENQNKEKEIGLIDGDILPRKHKKFYDHLMLC